MDGSKPNLSDLKKGFFPCPGCAASIPLGKYEGLSVVDCPSCSSPVFIPKRIKNFWLYEPLGGGGMGSVYKSVAEEELGEFAVKVLPRNKKTDSSLAEALEREGETGKILGKFPHIAEVVDFGEEEGEHFIASRFVQGIRLDIYISTASRLSERQAVDIILQIVDAEIHIVNCGFLYRDVKPENVIIVEETATAKLFDFGLCISLERAANPNPEEKLEGSPFYLPPERIVAAPEGEFSEVYSLGMLLFHMLAGTTYFSQADARKLVSKHVQSVRMPDVGSKLPNCSGEVTAVLDEMIQRDPGRRIASLDDLKLRLEEVLQHASGYPLAASDALGVDDSKWKRRVRSPKTYLYLFAAVLATAAVAAGLFAAWRYRGRLEKRRRERIVISSVASELGIPVDVKPPDATLREVAVMVEDKARKARKKKAESLPSFDETFYSAKICKDLGISVALDEKPAVTLERVEKLAAAAERALEEKELAKIVMEFDAEKATRDAAAKLGVEFPVTKPSMTPEEIGELASKKASERTVEKYPSKMLALANSKIVEKYKPHRVGEQVSVRKVTTGELISGEFKGVTSYSKVIIGGEEVLINDLTDVEQVRFSPGIASVKVAACFKQTKERFKKLRQEFYTSTRADIERQLFENNRYLRDSKGHWIAAEKAVAAAVLEARKKFEKAKRDKEAVAKTNARRLFDREGFFKRYGYRRVDGAWNSDLKTVKVLLAKRRAAFERKRGKELGAFMDEARKNAAEELYPLHGYIRWGGEWIPAKTILDREIRKELDDLDERMGPTP